MSFFGTVCSLVSNAISVIGPALTTAGKYLGGAVGKGIVEFGKIIMNMPKLSIEEIVETVKFVAEVVREICVGLGIIKEENTPEELGAKALDADKKPDDFDSVEEYIDYLENEIKLDKEKFTNMTKEEKLACTAVGSTILANAISEKKDIEVSMEFLAEVAKQKMEAKEVETYINNFKEKEVDLDLTGYLKGNLSVGENRKVGPIIYETIKELNPNLSDDEVEARIDEMISIALRK